MAAATEEHLGHMLATAPELGSPHVEGSYSPLELGGQEDHSSTANRRLNNDIQEDCEAEGQEEEEESSLPTPYEIFDLTADDSSQDNSIDNSIEAASEASPQEAGLFYEEEAQPQLLAESEIDTQPEPSRRVPYDRSQGPAATSTLPEG